MSAPAPASGQAAAIAPNVAGGPGGSMTHRSEATGYTLSMAAAVTCTPDRYQPLAPLGAAGESASEVAGGNAPPSTAIPLGPPAPAMKAGVGAVPSRLARPIVMSGKLVQYTW